MDFETIAAHQEKLLEIKRELAERITTRAAELHKKHDNPLAVTNVVLLEELARLELRMRAMAEATIEATTRPLPRGFAIAGHYELRAIADGKDLP